MVSAGPIIAVHSTVIANDYVIILGHHVHPNMQCLFPDGDVVSQDEKVLFT